MFCPKCGNEYDDSFNFCPACSEPKPQTTQQPGYQAQQEYPPIPPPPIAQKKKFVSSWRFFVVIGVVVLLVITGVTLGLVFGLGGGRNLVGTYVYSGETLKGKLILMPDGVAKLDSTVFDEPVTCSYVVKGDTVKVSGKSGGFNSEFTIVDENLVDEAGTVWTKQGTSTGTNDISPEIYEEASSNAQKRTCQSNIRTVDGAIQSYQAMFDTPVYPTSLNDMTQPGTQTLKSIPTCPSGDEPYIWVPGDPPMISCPNNANHTI